MELNEYYLKNRDKARELEPLLFELIEWHQSPREKRLYINEDLLAFVLGDGGGYFIGTKELHSKVIETLLQFFVEHIQNNGKLSACKYCQRKIFWSRTSFGKLQPFEVTGIRHICEQGLKAYQDKQQLK